MSPLFLPLLYLLLHFLPALSLDFLFNSFNSSDLILVDDAKIDSSVIRLTNDSNQNSIGRAFYPTQINMKSTSNSAKISSFSTSFVFSVYPEISSSPGFGIAFVISNTTSPPNALSGQYFGLFSNSTKHSVIPLIAIEFDTGQNPEFNDPDGNHVGIDLDNIESIITETAGYYDSASGNFTPVNMRSGNNARAWIEFDGSNMQINVTIAPIGVNKPSKPLLSYTNPEIADYVSDEMFVGFSASKVTWVEIQRVLAWSFSDTGTARDINTTNLPNFVPKSKSSLSPGAIVGISIACVVVFVVFLSGFYWYWRRRRVLEGEDEEMEDWELEFWPHRFSYEELSQATSGFSKENLLGTGGFGRVYKGNLAANNNEVAVKCVNHDSKQGLREFMAEISSIGRLQHKNLVPMRGWCRKGNELLLVYDYMPNGSLNNWVFDKPKKVLDWKGRLRVLTDVAEGLNYLHHGYNEVVLHRDIKSSNILLDGDMRGRLGDFGLAKLYQHGGVPSTTRVVGTLGYLAPELASLATPTAASDVYSFGVVILEVVSGRRPIEAWSREDEPFLLIDWVRELYSEGKVSEACDDRVKSECEAGEIEMALKLGLACCHPHPQHRPSMKEIVAILCSNVVVSLPENVEAELAHGGCSGSNGNNAGLSSDSTEPQSQV
ncbi:Legume lectin domain [Dillenia turbinata]|uniref:non-specific serine/threonine protein kinase n=1 Tax=Dillenia turbinata TaxID=194707 RepID=A0AAN8URY3_9MAGN